MPGLDGYATAAEIRRLEAGRRRTPIAAITANATKDVRKRCEEAGMDGFVPKPTTLNDLAIAIERWDLPFDETALQAFGAVAAETPEGLTALLQDFADDARSRLDAARAGLAGGDFDACRREAHAIKGAAASVGARGLAELCRLLEAAAEASDAPRETETTALLTQAEAELARVRADAARRAAA
jgi:HPt (histidine-containing phosphotransfer) domain-containing protein